MKCLLDAWNKNQQPIFNWLVKQTHDPQQAKDIMQDVFLNAMKNTDRFCDLDDAKSWLFKMVKNRYIDELRKQISIEAIDHAFPATHIVQSPIVQMEKCLPVILQKLSFGEREIIEQCDLQGITQQKYAQMHNLSLSAVKSRLQRARKQLKKMMINHCNVKQVNGYICCFKGSKHSTE